MRAWPTLIIGVFILTLGLIACFAPGGDDVVDEAARVLPIETPFFVAIASPEPLFQALSDASLVDAPTPRTWSESGVDLDAPVTFARWPGERAFFVLSFGLSDVSLAEGALDELINTLTASHRLVIDGARAHVLVALNVPEPEAWRQAARRLEAPRAGESLSQHERLEPLGDDALVIHSELSALASTEVLPRWLSWLLNAFTTCTARVEGTGRAWQTSVSCHPDEDAEPLTLLATSVSDTEPLGNDAEARLNVRLSLPELHDLWESLSERSEGLDVAHTAWLDIAAEAKVSPHHWVNKALNGEVALSLLRWPTQRRPGSLVARLGVSDEALVSQLLEGVRGMLDSAPGVRVEVAAHQGEAGVRIAWLGHREHPLSWVLHRGALYLAYGGADLEDALDVPDVEPWEAGDRPLSAWVDLSESMGLEGIEGGLEVTVDRVEGALKIAAHMTPHEEVKTHTILEDLLDWVHVATRDREMRALRRELRRLCDVIDLHAIDQGLPTRLVEVQGVGERLDPWGRPFVYTQPAQRRPHQRYDLCSLGSDGIAMTPDDVCYH